MMLRSNWKKQKDGAGASNEENLAIKKILGERIHDGVTEYKVKWVGYPDTDITWEPSTNLNSES